MKIVETQRLAGDALGFGSVLVETKVLCDADVKKA